MPLWWGTLGFIVIEGLSFVFSIAVYLYLQSQNTHWPLNPPPALWWSSAILLLFLLSEIPNEWTKRAAAAHDLGKVRIGLLIMSGVAIVILGLRVFEFTTLNVRWDENAYGSIVWFLLALHTTHVMTDAGETFVMTALVFVGPIDVRRFSEVDDNQNYWHFVVLSWIPIYLTLYWIPRLLGSVP
jgi:heme/copper-type cytochrome/quinol oxidase subunit 3